MRFWEVCIPSGWVFNHEKQTQLIRYDESMDFASCSINSSFPWLPLYKFPMYTIMIVCWDSKSIRYLGKLTGRIGYFHFTCSDLLGSWHRCWPSQSIRVYVGKNSDLSDITTHHHRFTGWHFSKRQGYVGMTNYNYKGIMPLLEK